MGCAVCFFCFMLGGSSDNLYEEWVMKDSKNQFKEAIQDKERSKNAMKILDEMIDDAKSSTRSRES